MTRLQKLIRYGSRLPLFLATVLAVAHPSAQSGSAEGQFFRDVEELTSRMHRSAGSAEGDRAAEYLVDRVKAIGGYSVFVQKFPLVTARIVRCEMSWSTAPGGEVCRERLEPLRPNGILLPVTPPEGLRKPVLVLERGDLSEVGAQSVTGSIVVIPYDSGDLWRRLFRMGATAVIFTGRGENENLLHSEANVNFPRFYYSGDPATLRGVTELAIDSEIVWERGSGTNIIAVLRGTNPRFEFDADEAILLSIPYTTFGEVPGVCPGARGAANVAAGLRIAEALRVSPSRRDTILLFAGADERGLAGTTAFYRAIEQNIPELLPNIRRASLDNETNFIHSLLTGLSSENLLVGAGTMDSVLRKRMEEKIADQSRTLIAQIGKLRGEKTDIEAVAEERQRRIDQALAAKIRWNELRRALVRGEPTAPWQEEMSQTRDEVLADLHARQSELVLEKEYLRGDSAVRQAVEGARIQIHASLLLGDATRYWGVLVGGDSDFRSTSDVQGEYGRIMAALLSLGSEISSGRESHILSASMDGTFTSSRVIMPCNFLVHGGDIAGCLGIANVVIGTVGERLSREGTPADTPDDLDLNTILAQANEVGAFVSAAGDSARLSTRIAITPNREYFQSTFGENGQLRGPRAMGKALGSPIFNTPLAGCIVQITPKNQPSVVRTCSYFENFQVVVTNANGSYSYGPVTTSAVGGRQPEAAFAIRTDTGGRCEWASTREMTQSSRTRLNLLPVWAGGVMLVPSEEPWFGSSVVFDGISGANLAARDSFSRISDGCVLWFCEQRIKGVKLFGSAAVGLNGGQAPVIEQGADRRAETGFPAQPLWPVFDTARQSAVDLWRLNESRLALLRGHGVLNASVEELHGRVEDLLHKSEQGKEALHRDAQTVSAFWSEWPVYNKTRGMMDDLVKAVLVLLMLSVPFSFMMERLLIGATHIFRQVAGFVLFFILVFSTLYFSHPAFGIANTPLIIFLGFTVVLLSSAVVVIIMRKFEMELKSLQGLSATIHNSDVSRMGTMLAAMSMGISTMRRRPVRTALTAMTVILLTFTIIFFAAFEERLGVQRVYTGPPAAAAGILVSDPGRSELQPAVCDLLHGSWGHKTEGYPRLWRAPSPKSNHNGILLAKPDGSNVVVLDGILGIDPAELEHRPDLAAVLGNEGLKERVLLTRAAADLLGVSSGEMVILDGIRLRVGPLLDAAQLSSVKDVNGEGILPVDLKADEELGRVQPSSSQGIDSIMLSRGSWSYVAPDSVAVVSAETGLRLGAKPHAIALYASDLETTIAVADDLARTLPLTVAASGAGGTYLHALGVTLAASGVWDLFFLIFLGGLIVFGTMLGSISDREREISTFSALGLTPRHVAGLFLAEAIGYSVIGGFGGYLLAQASMKLLGWFADLGLIDMPEMNHSSTNVVFTIIMVMATVLVSAIYPAIKASRSANPGLLRHWALPEPNGDDMHIVFPFTVSEYDLTGVVSFLREHFDEYRDVGLGSFITHEAHVTRESADSVGLDAILSLAPFDLGVTQGLALRSKPSEIPGISEVSLHLVRRSGQPKDWVRLNKPFLSDLRRQFLLWRTLPRTNMEKYRLQTLSANVAGGEHGEDHDRQ